MKGKNQSQVNLTKIVEENQPEVQTALSPFILLSQSRAQKGASRPVVDVN